MGSPTGSVVQSSAEMFFMVSLVSQVFLLKEFIRGYSVSPDTDKGTIVLVLVKFLKDKSYNDTETY